MNAPVTTAQLVEIPFREEGPSIADGTAIVLGAFVLVLAVTMGLLVFARRRGLPLPKWLGTMTEQPGSGIAIDARLRLSPRTVLYRVRDGESVLHIVESTGTIRIHEVRPEPTP